MLGMLLSHGSKRCCSIQYVYEAMHILRDLFKSFLHSMQVNFLTFEGDALSPGGSLRVAVLGSNALVMSTYSSALSLIRGTFNGGVDADTIADAVVDSAYQVSPSYVPVLPLSNSIDG